MATFLDKDDGNDESQPARHWQIGQSLLSTLVEVISDAIVIVDHTGSVVFANSQAQRLFDYTKAPLTGRSVDDLLPVSADRSWTKEFYTQCKVASSPVQWTARRSDGGEFLVEVHVSPVVVGDLTLTMAILRDLSPWRQSSAESQTRAEQEAAIARFGRQAVSPLELSELIQQAALSVAETLGNAGCAVLQLSIDHSLLFCKSLAFAPGVSSSDRERFEMDRPVHMASLSGFALRSSQVVAYHSDDPSPLFDTSILKSFGVESALAVPLHLQDGQWGTLTVYSFQPREFSLADTHFAEAIGSLLSVAIERKLAEDAVRRDRDFAESLIHTAQAIVLVLDEQGRIVRFNAYTEEISGRPLAEVRGTSWSENFLPALHRSTGRNFFNVMPPGTNVVTAIFPIIGHNAAEREIEWSGRNLLSIDGELTARMFIGHDISELREAQQQLLESERLAAIGQMASGLAHESRNALQQIGACAEMLTMDLAGNREALELVEGVQQAEERLHRLFEDVRTYSVPLKLSRQIVALSEIWRKVWSESVSERRGCQPVLVEDIACADTNCLIDRTMVEHALKHIIENSLDAAGPHARLEIRCGNDKLDDRSALRLEVADNGPGISAEQLDRLFEPFFTTKTQGTGLGLPIARRLIEAQGGDLSAAPGTVGGMTFTLLLPRED